MADGGLGSGRVQAMLQQLAEEQRKIQDLHRKVGEARTVVESPNKMVTATFDGRGELTGLTFNNTRYRTMAPTELADVVLETVRRGRSSAMKQMGDMVDGDILPGVSFDDLTSGRLDMGELINTMMTSARDIPKLVERSRAEGSRTDG